MDNKIWNSKLVQLYNTNFNKGNDKDIEISPYYKNMFGWRKNDILFQYTQEELDEIIKCKNDIVYFANTYAFAMTDSGIQKITLRPYQNKIIKQFKDNRFLIYCSSRQSGKCVMFSTNITIRNKKTGLEERITILDLWYRVIKQYFKFNLFFYLKYYLYKVYIKLESYTKL